jgi:hypothetical protein
VRLPDGLRSGLELPEPGAPEPWSPEWREAFRVGREIAGGAEPHTGHLLLALLRIAPGWEPLALVARALGDPPLARALTAPAPESDGPRGLLRRRRRASDVERATERYLEQLRPHLSRVAMPADRRHLAAVCLQPGSVGGEALAAADVDVDALLAGLLALVVEPEPG